MKARVIPVVIEALRAATLIEEIVSRTSDFCPEPGAAARSS